MNNFVFSQKPSFDSNTYVIKDTIGFNRNFTANFMSNHMFQNR